MTNQIKFPKTIEVFDKISTNMVITPSDVLETMFGDKVIMKYTYQVSQKQFEWLAKTYSTESRGWDARTGVTVTDDQGTQYSFSYNNYMNNVPHYIPNQKKYGRKFFISKHVIQLTTGIDDG